VERVEFTVEGSQGDQYAVVFEVTGSKARAFCTCQAGVSGQYCKHRFSIMDGEVSRLSSGNTADVVRLKNLMQGTDLGASYARMLQAEAACADAKKELDAAKKACARTMYSRIMY
jgi:uncharacterized Zn finger protein